MDGDLRGVGRHGLAGAQRKGYTCPAPVLGRECDGGIAFCPPRRVDAGFIDIGRHLAVADGAGRVAGANGAGLNVGKRRRGYVAQRFDPTIAERDGIQASRLFHDHQAQGFHQMVLQHVLECAGPVIVGGASFQRQAFEPTDVYSLYMVGVEDRLKDLIGKTQGHDPPHQLIAEKVIDAKDGRCSEFAGQAAR